MTSTIATSESSITALPNISSTCPPMSPCVLRSAWGNSLDWASAEPWRAMKGVAVSQKGRSQPRIADEHIRTLSRLAKRQGVTMTTLLNLIVATALEDFQQALHLGDEPPRAPTLAPGGQGRGLEGGTRPQAHAPRHAPNHHDRQRVRPAPSVRQRHQRQKR